MTICCFYDLIYSEIRLFLEKITFMYSQVATQTPAFFEQINQLIVSKNPDPVILTRFKNEAQINKRDQSDNINGYLALGTLARLEGDIDALHANYQHAIAASTAQHVHIITLYAKCLTPFGLFSQAAELKRQAFDLSQGALNYLEEAIHFYGLAGRFHQVGELLKTWDKMSPDKAHQFSQLAGKVIDFMDEKNVSDADLEGLINIALSLLRQHELSIAAPQINISLLEDEDGKWLHYGIPLYDLSVEEMVDLDFELADRIAEEKLSANLTGYFVPTFEIIGE